MEVARQGLCSGKQYTVDISLPLKKVDMHDDCPQCGGEMQMDHLEPNWFCYGTCAPCGRAWEWIQQ